MRTKPEEHLDQQEEAHICRSEGQLFSDGQCPQTDAHYYNATEIPTGCLAESNKMFLKHRDAETQKSPKTILDLFPTRAARQFKKRKGICSISMMDRPKCREMTCKIFR